MAHKFPKPIINVKCGVCYFPLTWSSDIDTFECVNCMLRLEHTDTGVFRMVYTNPRDRACGHPPVESYKKVRHLRQNSKNAHYFVVFSYLFYPCSLPKDHVGHHFFHASCRYSEEPLNATNYIEENAKDIDLDN